MISRRETLVSLAALAAAAGPARVAAQTADEKPKLPKLVETPMFEPLVKEGKLPAIAKRVPAAPLVAMLEGEPGMPSRIEPINPPDTPPTQIDTSMAIPT